MTAVSAIVVAYGEEPWLARCVSSLLASDDVVVEVIVVDNTGTGGAVDALEGRDRVKVVRPGRNLGFAGGCNLGARSASGDVIALVNQDAVVEPATLRRLADVALRPGVAIATASVRLAHAPDRLNSAGNDVHFLGFGWSGSYDRPATARDVAEAQRIDGNAVLWAAEIERGALPDLRGQTRASNEKSQNSSNRRESHAQLLWRGGDQSTACTGVSHRPKPKRRPHQTR